MLISYTYWYCIISYSVWLLIVYDYWYIVWLLILYDQWILYDYWYYLIIDIVHWLLVYNYWVLYEYWYCILCVSVWLRFVYTLYIFLVCSWILMDVHGFQRMSLYFNGVQWIGMKFDASQSVSDMSKGSVVQGHSSSIQYVQS